MYALRPTTGDLSQQSFVKLKEVASYGQVAETSGFPFCPALLDPCNVDRILAYDRLVLTFEWDEAKNSSNQREHGASFEETQNALFDPRRIIRPDGYES